MFDAYLAYRLMLIKLSTMTSIVSVKKALQKCGPSRSRHLINELTESSKISQEAARQRLSRSGSPIQRLRNSPLPKGESFYYLPEQYESELYWENLLRDLRATRSIYGFAIDALDARGGVVPKDEFPTISGAPIALKKQVPSDKVERTLVQLGIMNQTEVDGIGRCYVANPDAIMTPTNSNLIKARRVAESCVLDVLRQWLRANRLGSFHKIAIRGENHSLKVGQFQWDLTGPCYLHFLRTPKSKLGFVAADVCLDNLDIHQIRYFIRKVQTYQGSSNSGVVLPILLADRFSTEAIKEGGKAGIMLVTPESLFGRQVAKALSQLIHTLEHIAYMVAEDSNQLFDLVNKISKIEGRSMNMRGIMFELLSAYIAGRIFCGHRIDIGVTHTHSNTGKRAELDIVCMGHDSAYVIECKGLGPNGRISLEEVSKWLEKIPIAKDFIAQKFGSTKHEVTYLFWTTGRFADDALEKLKDEKQKRIRQPIEFRSGVEMRSAAVEKNLKRVAEALDEHFLKHPLTDVNRPTRKQLNYIADLRDAIASETTQKILMPPLLGNADRADAAKYIAELREKRERLADS